MTIKFALTASFVLVLACRPAADEQLPVPVPPGAVDASTIDRGEGVTLVTFRHKPGTGAMDFYEAWADDRGWEVVPREEEQWTSDGWQSFELSDGTPVAQWATHWRSTDLKWSLLVGLRQASGQGEQTVYVLYGPYHLLTEFPDGSPPAKPQ